MKKHTLSLILIVLFVGLAIPLQAGDNPEVQVYGQVRLSVDHNSSDFGDGAKGASIKSNSSRLGVRGVMPSAIDGMDIIYCAEMKYGAADEKDAEIEWREGYAGLKGKWGKFRLGRLSVQYKGSLTKIDPWNDNVPQSRGVGGRQGTSAFHSSYINNAVDYVSPKINGISASVWASSQFDGEKNEIHNAGPFNKYIGGTAAGFGARYEQGPLFVAADLLNIDADSITSDSMMDNGAGWQIAARYKTSDFSVSAFYEDLGDLGLGTNLYVNGIFTLDKLRLIASYGQNRDAALYDNRDINSWSLGGKYALGTSTEFFGVYNSRDEGAKVYNTISSGINVKFGY